MSACEPLRPRKAGSRLLCQIIEEKELPKHSGTSIWKAFDHQQPELQQGLLQQLHGQYRCSERIRRELLMTCVEYLHGSALSGCADATRVLRVRRMRSSLSTPCTTQQGETRNGSELGTWTPCFGILIGTWLFRVSVVRFLACVSRHCEARDP